MTRRLVLFTDWRDRSGVLHPAGSTVAVAREDDFDRLVRLGLGEPAAEPEPRAHRPPEPLAIATPPRVFS